MLKHLLRLPMKNTFTCCCRPYRAVIMNSLDFRMIDFMFDYKWLYNSMVCCFWGPTANWGSAARMGETAGSQPSENVQVGKPGSVLGITSLWKAAGLSPKKHLKIEQINKISMFLSTGPKKTWKKTTWRPSWPPCSPNEAVNWRICSNMLKQFTYQWSD